MDTRNAHKGWEQALIPNENSSGLEARSLTMDMLFEKI